MPDKTLIYYSRNAAGLNQRYEKAKVAGLHSDLSNTFQKPSLLLELGCGSGREAAFLRAQGHTVIATDGSCEMLSHAIKSHAELDGFALALALPAVFPFRCSVFSGACAIAVLMHLSPTGLSQVITELKRVLGSQALLFVSVPSERGGLDCEGRDREGRFFCNFPRETWISIFEERGFNLEFQRESDDGLGRDKIKWFNLVFRKK